MGVVAVPAGDSDQFIRDPRFHSSVTDSVAVRYLLDDLFVCAHRHSHGAEQIPVEPEKQEVS